MVPFLSIKETKDMIDSINWYPGHMKKTREMIQENLKLVDLVVEVVDARIPVSSRNPILDEIVKDKKRVIAFNKSDLADNLATTEWVSFFQKKGLDTIPLNAVTGTGINQFHQLLNRIQEKRNQDRQRFKALRMMVIGVPNVGKSSLINRLTGKKSTRTGDRPGITRGKQWLTLTNGMQLLDTPGILWPKFEDPSVGKNLAFCGSIKDEILDTPSLALELVSALSLTYPKLLKERYKMEELGETPLATMECIATNRGFILPGKRIDYERTGRTLLDEFRGGALGPITLERAPKEG